MDSIVVPPLAEKARACCWLLTQSDSAVGPGLKHNGSHVQARVRVARTHGGASQQPPLHRGCGDPTEGAAALQCLLLPGAGGVEQPGRCWGRRASRRHAACLLCFRRTQLSLSDSEGASERPSRIEWNLGSSTICPEYEHSAFSRPSSDRCGAF